MKHIKQYEQTIESKYKKFAVWKKLQNYDLMIIEIILEEPETIDMKTLLIYNKKNNEIEPFPYKSKISKYYKTYVNKHIIYTSNLLKDCKDKVELLMNVNKYNI